MKALWGKSTNPRVYSQRTVDIFNKLMNDTREVFNKEFSSILSEPAYHQELYRGRRFYDNDQILWVLTSNVDEVEFSSLPQHYIMRALLGACEADYYYTYEKQWN